MRVAPVQPGEYGNTSEYLRDLIRRDRREQAALRLRSLIADGLESGEGRVVDGGRVGNSATSPSARGKPAQLRPLAEQDLIERTRYYVAVEDAVLRERFFDEAIAALLSVEDRPGIGSPLFGELTGVDGLRRIGVTGFPCSWIYIERRDDIDVIRLLADKQDLEDLLGGATA